MAHVMLFLMLSTLVLAAVCVLCPVSFFGRSLILCFPGMLLRYFANNFEMISAASVFTFVFTFHSPCLLLLLLFVYCSLCFI